MKINHVLLVLLLAFCAPWSAKGQGLIYQDPLTVNDGTSVSSTIPFYGSFVAYGTGSQFIIPSADLVDMRGGMVTKLLFYSRNRQYQSWGSAQFSIYMAEVTDNGFNTQVFADWGSMTQVYTGSLSLNNYVMEIALDNAFTYYGGNLMIGFMEIEPGTNSYGYINWNGVTTATTGAMYSFSNMYSIPTSRIVAFLPKTTFEYYVLDLPAVEVALDDLTPNTASFSWEAPSSDVTGYKYQYNKAFESYVDNWVELPSTATSMTLEGLDPITDYTIRFKTCYGEHESAMTVLDFKTSCPEYTSIPYFENFDSFVVNDNLFPNSRVLPDCWDYINTSMNPADSVFPSVQSMSVGSGFPFAHSLINELYFYIDNRSVVYEAQPEYVILPKMQNIRGLRLTLYARSYSTSNWFSSNFTVGVMEETETGCDFIPIQVITPTMAYQSYSVDFNSYGGVGERIAIWMEVPSTDYGNVFIDDVAVEELPQFSVPIVSHGGTRGGWYMISSPLADAVNALDVPQLINEDVLSPDFDLFRFNPNPETPGLIWENWKQVGNHYHFNLEPGRGYLYANADNVNLNFVGTPYNGNGEVTLHYDEDEEFGGWNLIGNPYPIPAYIGDREYLTMNDDGSGFVPATAGSPIGVMQGIFVYTETEGEVVTFDTIQTQNRGEQLSLTVSKTTRSGFTTAIDRAILSFNNGHKLPKFQFNKESSKVYIPQNGRDYAVVSAEGQGEMPVNFSADENGTYTLSFSCESVEFSYLHLFDNKTGTDVDLLRTPSYTFNATTMDYESRFKLVYATGSSIDDNSFTFLNSNGNFSIFGIEGEATLQVLDVMGRVLSTETFNGSIEKRLDVAPGVYFIRLVSGNDMKTQKIVVR